VRQYDCSSKATSSYTPVHPIAVVHPCKFWYTLGCTIHPVDKHWSKQRYRSNDELKAAVTTAFGTATPAMLR